jgi:predicted Rossmann-fold nucleotide-binding protein
MEEFFEAATWAQLGIHSKPLGLLNVHGYFDLIHQFFGHAVRQGFLQIEHQSQILIDSKPAKLLEALQTHKPISVVKASLSSF